MGGPRVGTQNGQKKGVNIKLNNFLMRVFDTILYSLQNIAKLRKPQNMRN
jgi:hypothetical protein